MLRLRLAALVASALASAPAARADAIRAVPARSLGVALEGHASSSGGVDEGGGGPTLELALGHRRLQVIAELGVALAGVNVSRDGGYGGRARLGAGVRWIARSFDADDAAVDLLLEGFGGVEHLWWKGDGHLTRPQLGVGAGWQVRWPSSAFTVRITTRIYMAPTLTDPAPAPVCRGTCTTAAADDDHGFMTLVGVAW